MVLACSETCQLGDQVNIASRYSQSGRLATQTGFRFAPERQGQDDPARGVGARPWGKWLGLPTAWS